MAVWSEVNWSSLTADHRLDAEYYRPEYLRQAGAIARLPHKPLFRVADVSDGNHISIAENFTETGVRYLRGKDLSDFFISDADPVYIPEGKYKAIKRSHMHPGDVLLGVVATIGTVSLVKDRFDKLTGNCKIAIVRPKEVEPEFLAAFFLSAVGQGELNRRARGTVQRGVILPDLKALPIPLLPSSKRAIVSQRVKAAYAKRTESEKAYAESQALLVSALALDKLDLTARLFYEGHYKSLTAAGRFDAEYYQPAKLVVLHALAKMKGRPVGEQYRSAKSLWQPGKVARDQHVRNYDLPDALSPFLDDTIDPKPAAEIGSTKKRLQAGDLVVSRLRSYLKEIAVVLPSAGVPMVCSTEFIVLRPAKDAIRAEALLVYLRSPYVQTVLMWCQDGSNHPRFDEKEILGLRVPKALAHVQDKLAELVKQSIAARREARRMLHDAKQMVEDAIVRQG
jgi:hypothetical protein